MVLIEYLLDIPIYQNSNSQRRITNETEYASIFEASKEIKFIYFLLKDIHMGMILLIIVENESVGGIFISNIFSLSHCLKVNQKYLDAI
jgi:hypothetical protein